MKKTTGESLKSILSITLAVMLVLCVSMTSVSFAGNGDTKEITEKKGELNDVQESIGDKKDALSDGKKEASELSAQIKELEKQIYAADAEINEKQKEINETKLLISDKLTELSQKQVEIDEQNEELGMRLRAMYKNGETGMLAVLFGSSSMSDFMTNMDMVQRIYESDTALLTDMQDAYGVIADKKQELQDLKNVLVAQEAEMQAKKDAIEEDRADLKAKKSSIDADNKKLEAQIDKLNAEAKALSAEIKKLQSAAKYVGGQLQWPAQSSTYISSPFGNRIHPILKVYKFHTGIDIAAAQGTNILAANDGKVISACYNSGYGYMIMVDHGGGIVTLYAHSSKLLVKTGDQVKRGQVIALVGSTGNSTGPHLHFEVRVNGEYKNPIEYLTKK